MLWHLCVLTHTHSHTHSHTHIYFIHKKTTHSYNHIYIIHKNKTNATKTKIPQVFCCCCCCYFGCSNVLCSSLDSTGCRGEVRGVWSLRHEQGCVGASALGWLVVRGPVLQASMARLKHLTSQGPGEGGGEREGLKEAFESKASLPLSPLAPSPRRLGAA